MNDDYTKKNLSNMQYIQQLMFNVNQQPDMRLRQLLQPLLQMFVKFFFSGSGFDCKCSELQASQEFQTWLDAHPNRRPNPDHQQVLDKQRLRLNAIEGRLPVRAHLTQELHADF
jgi:hypothetical protein